ncbi:hypothetical protein C8D72_3460 [Kushneria indalinina DSM 14324]|uniref:Uncharacterized protein n=1 Tax=Kushneria indalinina DSM 14324 TaxID=1122140 RepID=A0A3D9DSC6_9GAMM|nr:hypothetical protein C8D72_3460 [Kushneria indalinina DSM 14324]
MINICELYEDDKDYWGDKSEGDIKRGLVAAAASVGLRADSDRYCWADHPSLKKESCSG